MHKNSTNLRRGHPLGFRVSADNYVHLRTKYVDTSGGKVPLALLQASQNGVQTSTFKIFNSIGGADVQQQQKPQTGATPDENATEVPAHVTVSAISRKENRAQLLRKIDELSNRIERLRSKARGNDSALRKKVSAYKEALRKQREANRAMELHVREQLREQVRGDRHAWRSASL